MTGSHLRDTVPQGDRARQTGGFGIITQRAIRRRSVSRV
jgi:hypothetical protein